MRRGYFILLAIVLVFTGCNADISDLGDSVKILEKNISKSGIPDGWHLMELNDTSAYFMNDIYDIFVTIEESERLDSGGLDFDEYLENLCKIYNSGDMGKVITSEIVEVGNKHFGLMELETIVESKIIRQLRVCILLDNKEVIVGGQNIDNSNPENLRDILLEIALLIKNS